jgi:uncharacterized membrane protein
MGLFVMAVCTVTYLVGWTAIPLLDKLAINKIVVVLPPSAHLPLSSSDRTIEEDVEKSEGPIDNVSLTWCIFLYSTLFLSTYVFLFTRYPVQKVTPGLISPYVMGSAAFLMAATLAYFRVLEEEGGMMAVAMLQPILLVCQIVVAATVMREPMDVFKYSGLSLVVVGMGTYNVPTLLSFFKKE